MGMHHGQKGKVESGKPATSEAAGNGGQLRETRHAGVLKLFETARRNLGTAGKTSRSRFGQTTKSQGDNFGRTFRKRIGWSRELYVTIVSIDKPKAVGQRTGAPATRTAEAMAAMTVKRILVRVFSNTSRR